MSKYRHIVLLLPPLGTLIFVFLYLMACHVYPGGSLTEPQEHGFNWRNNFWCNLLNTIAINGSHNDARPWALAGMCVLGITLILFWYYVPRYLDQPKPQRMIIGLAGFLTLIISFLLLTGFHDEAINVGGFFGIVSFTGILIGLYRAGYFKLYMLGLLAILMGMGNSAIYYTGLGMINLAVLQKITFVIFLLWFFLVCGYLYITSGKDK